MDIKRQVFDEIISRYHKMFAFEKANIERIAECIMKCIANQGVVQVCGVGHAEEFANELNYRAGGIAPVHALRVDDLYVRGIINEQEKKEFYRNRNNYLKFVELYDLRDEDLYILVSLTGSEPLLIEIAKQAKEKAQTVIVICNQADITSAVKQEETIFDYCDYALDICAEQKDMLVEISGVKVGQSWTTTANVMAQMITGEVYHCYQKAGKECPILLSANLKDADIHNNALTDIYGRRVR